MEATLQLLQSHSVFTLRILPRRCDICLRTANCYRTVGSGFRLFIKKALVNIVNILDVIRWTMPNFTFKRRKSQPLEVVVPQTRGHLEQRQDNLMPSPQQLSAVNQKIHPDLNLLAEELESSLGHDSIVDVSPISQQATTTNETGFASLPPSVRKNRASISTHLRAFSDGMKQSSSSNETSQPDLRSVRTTSTRRKPFRGQPLFTGVTSKNSPSVVSSPPSPGGRWSTFGRKTAHDARMNSQYDNDPRGRDSLSRRSIQSRATSRSRGSTDTEPRTPQSFAYSQHNSTQQSFSSQVFQTNISAPSPGTFGIPTPSSSGVTFGSSQSSRIGNQAVPPPLPPLDHPAFRITSTGQPLLSRTLKEQIPGDTQERLRSQSLPSLAPSSSDHHSSRTRSVGLTKRLQNAGKRKSSVPKTSSHDIPSKNSYPVRETSSKTRHSRAASKSSVSSSRRSSAEYSAKKASSTGHGGEYEQCWEVQVSQEMLRLAFDSQGQQRGPAAASFPNQDFNTPASGKARGDNRPIEGAQGLRSPFLLKDTHSHNTAHLPYEESYEPSDIRHQYPRRTVPKYTALDIMSEDHVINTSSGNKEKDIDAAVTGSQSRRGIIPGHTRSSSLGRPKLNTIGDVGPTPGSSLLVPPTLAVIAATPEASPISPSRRSHHKSQPTEPSLSVLQNASRPPPIQKSYSTGSAKRKASEAEVEGDKTPPKVHRATFAPEPRTHRTSGTSHSSHGPPSSFNRNKRPRISGSYDSRTASGLSTGDSPNAKSTGSWSSKGSSNHHVASPSKPPSTITETTTRRASSRRSLSQASIPISALVSPHAPSIARSSTFHMRDPRKPAPIQSTPWSLSFPSEVQRGESRWEWKGWVERGGSPLHAWLFFVGFIVFPLWWAAGFLISIPRTRRLEGNDMEKGVVLDDPQVEHDAKSWRTRCRIMAVVSIFTYIPFIVLVAIFAR